MADYLAGRSPGERVRKELVSAAGELVYLAPTRINLGLTLERWPDVVFRETREHLAAAA